MQCGGSSRVVAPNPANSLFSIVPRPPLLDGFAIFPPSTTTLNNYEKYLLVLVLVRILNIECPLSRALDLEEEK